MKLRKFIELSFFVVFLLSVTQTLAVGQTLNRSMSNTDPNLNAEWDWTVNQNYTVYWKRTDGSCQSRTGLALPYFASGHPSAIAFNNNGNPDILPSDGWRLLIRDLGTSQSCPRLPYLALYNKYTGVVRIFIYAANRGGSFVQSANFVFATLELTNDDNIPLFTFNARKNASIEDYDTSHTETFIGKNLIPDQWTFAEFDLKGYDPQLSETDKVNASLLFTFYALEESQFQVDGNLSLSGFIEDATLQSSVGSDGGLDTIERGEESLLSAFKNFSSLAGAINGMKEFANENDGSWWAGPIQSIAQGATSTLIPGIGAAAGFITEFFGGTSGSGIYVPLRWRADLSGGIELSGTISTPSPFATLQIAVPGTDQNSGAISQTPLYDKPLGVFNIAKKPALENAVFEQSRSSDPNLPYDTGYTIYHYDFSLFESPGVVTNPYSGLSLVDVEMAFTSKETGVLNVYRSPEELVDKKISHVACVPEPGSGGTGDNTLIVPARTCDVQLAVRLTFEPEGATVNLPDELTLLKTYDMQPFASSLRHKPLIGSRPSDCSEDLLTTCTAGPGYGDPVPTPPLQVSVNGPSSLEEGVSGSYTANVTGGYGVMEIKWFKNDRYVSSNPSYTAAGYSDFIVSVQVQRERRSKTASKSVEVVSPPPPSCDDFEFACWKSRPDNVQNVEQYALLPPYPNPSVGQSSLRFSLPENAWVRIDLYDLMGRRVRRVVNTNKEAGHHSVFVDTSQMKSGVYVYRITANSFTATQRMTVVK